MLPWLESAAVFPSNTAIAPWLIALLLFALWYEFYLRRYLRLPRRLRARRKGLDLLLSGKPAKAERVFRKALVWADPSDKVRLLACLADSLIDQGRLEEAKTLLEETLALGDPIGSAQASMAELLMATGDDPQRALALAEQAMALTLAKSRPGLYFGGNVLDKLRSATCLARGSRALAQLNRRAEARESLNQAREKLEEARLEAPTVSPDSRQRDDLGDRRIANSRASQIAHAHWIVGLALVAIDEPKQAIEHFRITRDTDRRGKYRRLAEERLARMGAL